MQLHMVRRFAAQIGHKKRPLLHMFFDSPAEIDRLKPNRRRHKTVARAQQSLQTQPIRLVSDRLYLFRWVRGQDAQGAADGLFQARAGNGLHTFGGLDPDRSARCDHRDRIPHFSSKRPAFHIRSLPRHCAKSWSRYAVWS